MSDASERSEAQRIAALGNKLLAAGDGHSNGDMLMAASMIINRIITGEPDPKAQRTLIAAVHRMIEPEMPH